MRDIHYKGFSHLSVYIAFELIGKVKFQLVHGKEGYIGYSKFSTN